MGIDNVPNRLRLPVLGGLILSAAFFGSDATAQFHVLHPAPAYLKIAEEPDSPVRLSIDGVRLEGGELRLIQLKAENLGSKGIFGIATAGMLNGENNALSVLPTPLRPGYSTTLSIFIPRPVDGERNISLDSVLFEDGTAWGPDRRGNGEFFRGRRAGLLRFVTDVSEELSKNDATGFQSFVERRPYLPEYTKIQKKSRFEETLVRTYGAELLSLQQDLNEGGLLRVAGRITVLKEQLGLLPRSRGKRIARASGINDVIKIERLDVGGRPVGLNDEFSAGDDWLRGAMFTLKNVSGKRIASLSLTFVFPETTATGNRMSYTVLYGRRPGLLPDLTTATRPTIGPDETVEVGFTDDEFQKLDRFLNARQPLSQLSLAEISIGMVYFDDGTAWTSGRMMKRGAAPDSWIVIEKKE